MRKTSLVLNHKEGVITGNFEEVKEALKEYLADYENAFFTEESKAYAKKVLAGLRKEKKEAADRFKAVETEYMQPILDVKPKVKELLEMYDKPIALIDVQIKEIEERTKEEKRKIIQALYKECVSDLNLSEYIPLGKIYNLKWENSATSKKSIREDLMSTAYSVQKAVETIKNMSSEATEKGLELYKKTLSLTDAITYINSYETQKAEIEIRNLERIRLQEEERIRREERERIEAERRAQQEKEEALRRAEEEKLIAVEAAKAETQKETIENLIPDFDGASDLYEYRLSLTLDAKEKLELYLDSVGIEWEIINNG